MSIVCPYCGSSFILSTETHYLCNRCKFRFNPSDTRTNIVQKTEESGNSVFHGISIPKTIVKHFAQVHDDGIYFPAHLETFEGTAPTYNMLIPKDVFIEAVSKWVFPFIENIIDDKINNRNKEG